MLFANIKKPVCNWAGIKTTPPFSFDSEIWFGWLKPTHSYVVPVIHSFQVSD